MGRAGNSVDPTTRQVTFFVAKKAGCIWCCEVANRFIKARWISDTTVLNNKQMETERILIRQVFFGCGLHAMMGVFTVVAVARCDTVQELITFWLLDMFAFVLRSYVAYTKATNIGLRMLRFGKLRVENVDETRWLRSVDCCNESRFTLVAFCSVLLAYYPLKSCNHFQRSLYPHGSTSAIYLACMAVSVAIQERVARYLFNKRHSTNDRLNPLLDTKLYRGCVLVGLLVYGFSASSVAQTQSIAWWKERHPEAAE